MFLKLAYLKNFGCTNLPLPMQLTFFEPPAQTSVFEHPVYWVSKRFSILLHI